MIKKDFELIASVLRAFEASLPEPNTFAENDTQRSIAEQVRTQLAADFADALVATNPRFKRDLFLRECGVEA